jgi:hypothetical protein
MQSEPITTDVVSSNLDRLVKLQCFFYLLETSMFCRYTCTHEVVVEASECHVNILTIGGDEVALLNFSELFLEQNSNNGLTKHIFGILFSSSETGGQVIGKWVTSKHTPL